MGNNLVLFCKTFRGDFERFKILKFSIDNYNADNIPFYISCPKADISLFESLFDKEKYPYKIIADEKIIGVKNDSLSQNWYTQQIIKLKFYALDICEFYVCLDSDSYFIKEFFLSDFMYNITTPYITIYENKYFKELMTLLGDTNVFPDIKRIKNYLEREGKDYWYYPNPVLSCKVLFELEKNVDSIENLLKMVPLEYVWHGEYLLKSKCIEFVPCESNFKFFATQFELDMWKKNGALLDDFKKFYVGIIMQNRWCKQFEYKDSVLIHVNRRINRVIHFVNYDRKHIRKNFKFWLQMTKKIFKILITGES